MRALIEAISGGLVPKEAKSAFDAMSKDLENARGSKAFRNKDGSLWFGDSSYYGFPSEPDLLDALKRNSDFWMKPAGFRLQPDGDSEDAKAKTISDSNMRWISFTIEKI